MAGVGDHAYAFECCGGIAGGFGLDGNGADLGEPAGKHGYFSAVAVAAGPGTGHGFHCARGGSKAWASMDRVMWACQLPPIADCYALNVAGETVSGWPPRSTVSVRSEY